MYVYTYMYTVGDGSACFASTPVLQSTGDGSECFVTSTPLLQSTGTVMLPEVSASVCGFS